MTASAARPIVPAAHADLPRVAQAPNAPDFVQNPHGFYARARGLGPVAWWDDYAMPVLLGHAEVTLALKDRRLQRLPPGGLPPFPDHLQDFGRIEALSLLSLEGPDHARLRAEVLRAFTSARVAALADEIAALCHELIDRLPPPPFDLIDAYAAQVPVIVIARLLGVDPAACAQLRDWSNAMVAVYRPTVRRAEELRANAAADAFDRWLEGCLADRGRLQRPQGGLLAALQAAEAAGRLSRAETRATAILLLNAGHEASVHAIGLAATRLMGTGQAEALTRPDAVAATVEECLRLDAPLHVFTRWVHAPVRLGGHDFGPGDQIACLLGAANRDPAAYADPDTFCPGRSGPTLTSFGAGAHFCLGAPLARLELQIALRVLFERLPDMRPAGPPKLADIYHFHGYERLAVVP